MFTGLIETTGTIRHLVAARGGMRIGIVPDTAGFEVAAGDSVSVNGVCLTLEVREGDVLQFQAVEETLKNTTLPGLRPGGAVNLERALRPMDRIGGHFVLGHVDGVGRIRSDQRRGDSVERTVEVPSQLMAFCARKGSVAIDGVSLTIASVSGDAMTVALIPYSLRHTTMSALKAGGMVNIECDVLSRYTVHFLRTADPRGPEGGAGGGDEALYQKLQRLGY